MLGLIFLPAIDGLWRQFSVSGFAANSNKEIWEKGKIMKTQGLNHIQIEVSDMDKSLNFYSALFGMTELFREGSLVFLRSAEGNDVFTLRQASGPVTVDGGGLQHFGFAIKRQDHAAAVEEARRFGAEVLDVGQHGDDSLYAYIKDPDGYIIEIGG